MTYNDGNIYEGDWVNNQRFGKGVLKFKDGNKYEGEFSTDLINGKGIMKKRKKI